MKNLTRNLLVVLLMLMMTLSASAWKFRVSSPAKIHVTSIQTIFLSLPQGVTWLDEMDERLCNLTNENGELIATYKIKDNLNKTVLCTPGSKVISNPGIYTLTIPAGTFHINGVGNEECSYRWVIGDADITETIAITSECTDGNKFFASYYSEYAFEVPADLTVAQVAVEDGCLVVTPYNTGDIVGADTGVLVSSTTHGNHEVILSDATPTNLHCKNDMHPAWEIMPNDKYIYRLTMHNKEKIGFYWGAADGGIFNIVSPRAYLTAPKSVNAKELWIDGDITKIENLSPTLPTREGVYNLAGQRVNASSARGIVIVNGEKITKY